LKLCIANKTAPNKITNPAMASDKRVLAGTKAG